MFDEKKLIEFIQNLEMYGNDNVSLVDRDEILDFIENQPKVGEWIPCSERLPKPEEDVITTYVRKHWKTGESLYFVTHAFYEDGTLTTEDSNYVWNDIDNWKYDEDEDSYIIPEGWWESGDFSENLGIVDMSVIAWMPLPESYGKDGDSDAAD